MLNVGGLMQLYQLVQKGKESPRLLKTGKFLSILYTEQRWIIKKLASQLNFGMKFTTS